MNLWTIHKTAHTLVEGSDAWKLAQLWPSAVSHDGVNTIFVGSLEDAIDPFVLPTVDEVGEPLPDQLIVLLAAQHLLGDSERGMQLTKAQAETLFAQSIHRVWCARYEEGSEEQFRADYQSAGEFISGVESSIAWPEFSASLTPLDARQFLLTALEQISNGFLAR